MKLLSKTKFIILTVIIFTGAIFFGSIDAAAFEKIGDISLVSFETEDVYGNTFTFNGADGIPSILIYGGIPSCGNTTYTIRSVYQALGQLKGENLNVYAFDIKDNATSRVQGTANIYKNSEQMIFSSISSNPASKELYNFCVNKLGVSYLSMPLLVYKDADGFIYYLSEGAQTMESIGAVLDKSGLFSKKVVLTYSIEYEGYYLQDDARGMLSMINDFRTSSPWVWTKNNTKTIVNPETITYSYQLEKVAMKRAYEIALYYDHTRPDASPWYFAMDEADTKYAYSTAAENIAWGFKTAEEVFEAWKEEDKSYSDQGHRRNMLLDSVDEVGIAHVVVNGNDFWVQTFASSKENYDNTKTSISTDAKNFKVDIAFKNIKGLTFDQANYDLKCSETVDLSKITVYLQTYSSAPALKYPCVCEAKSDSLGAVKIEDGFIKYKKEGTASVYLYYMSFTGMMKVTYSHDYIYKKIRTDEHQKICKLCDFTRWDYVGRCRGGEATYDSPAICELCGKPHGTALQKTDASSLKVSLSSSAYAYDGKVKTPTVKVTTSDGTVVSSEDYTVTYSSGRKKAGTYSVKVTFKNAYEGEKKITFKINPPATALTSLSTKKGQITAKWNNKNTNNSSVDGYEIQYSTDSKFKKSVKKCTINKCSSKSTTIKKLTSKKTYYVRIRSYKTVGKTKYYSAWSASKKCKTK